MRASWISVRDMTSASTTPKCGAAGSCHPRSAATRNCLKFVIDGDLATRRVLMHGALTGLKMSSYRLNLIFMGVWVLIFIAWYSSAHVGRSHPGSQSQFWTQACNQDLRKACKTQHDLTLTECEKGNAYACAKLGDIYKFGTGVTKNEPKAYEYVGRACKMGLEKACELQHEYAPSNILN